MIITFNEKFVKRLLVIILIVLMAIFLIQVTYAKYKKYAQGLVDNDIAKWNIKVNSEDIRNKTTLTSQIAPVFEGDAYTKSGVIAPGTSGYFDVVIDATNSDVSFDYEIEVDKADSNTISDLVITGFSNEPGEVVANTTNNVTGSIVHNTASTSVRVFIEWDDATGSMNNADDTQATTESIKNANVLVKLHLTQKRN